MLLGLQFPCERKLRKLASNKYLDLLPIKLRNIFAIFVRDWYLYVHGVECSFLLQH